MWILCGLLVTAAVIFLGGLSLGEFGPGIILLGLILGSLWQVMDQLRSIREAIQEQTEALRRSSQNRSSAE